MPRLHVSAYVSSQTRRMSHAERRDSYSSRPVTRDSDISDSSSSTTDGVYAPSTRPCVSLPSFQEFLLSVSSSPNTPIPAPSLSVFNQPHATHDIQEQPVHGQMLQATAYSHMHSRTVKPSPQADHVVKHKKKRSLPVKKQIQYADIVMNQDMPEWTKYVSTSMTEIGKRVLVCTWPGCRYYALKNTLVIRHIETKHLGFRPHACRYCNQEFGQKSGRDVHERKLHTFEKPIKCEHCPKRFNDPARLSKHRNTDHGIKAAPRKEKPKLVS